MKEILLNIESKEKRCAVLKHGKLHDLIVARNKDDQITGNIYRGTVTNILNNIQSAFINIGESENGFIHINDIIENAQKFQEMFDMDFEWDGELPKAKKTTKKQEADIAKLLTLNQSVLVQVVKEPIGTKGARLTSNISIAGRYLVLLPGSPHRGVSRRIQEKNVRDRLKKAIRAFEMPQDMGLICRTASINATIEALVNEAHELLITWQEIMDKFHSTNKKSECLFRELDFVKRAITRAVDKKYDRVLIDDYSTYQYAKQIYNNLKEEHPLKLEMYRDKTAMFDRFGVEREIDRSLQRKIWLPSGGYLFFERTEAMYTVDVNSGRSTHGDKQGDVEETLVRINMEAAEEIARQLSIRNIGGLIICDFIDMRSRKNQRRVLDKLKEAMGDDSAKCTVLGMSEFGLVEMTRQRNRESLHQTLFTCCPYCDGKGVIKNNESIMIEIERAIKRISHRGITQTTLVSHPMFDQYLKKEKAHLIKVAAKTKVTLDFDSNDALHLNDYEFISKGHDEKIEV
ncbi:MAG: Rne/Rng family ribonuclease [Simkaniaceae bacterium]|nr:Rne/Rng family ribonuclease [Simkaniaceae bacterium]